MANELMSIVLHFTLVLLCAQNIGIGFEKQILDKNKIRRPDKCLDPIAIQAYKASRGPPFAYQWKCSFYNIWII